MNTLSHEPFTITRPLTFVSTLPVRSLVIVPERMRPVPHKPSLLHKVVRNIVVTVIAVTLFFVT